jgi:hypothetical protein
MSKKKGGEVSCKPEKCLRRELPGSTEDFQRIVADIEAHMSVDPAPEVASPNLTGSYEDEDGDRFTVQLNHASCYAELWVSKILKYSQGESHRRRVYRYVADTGTEQVFKEHDFESPIGTLKRSGAGKLVLDLSGDGWHGAVTLRKRTSDAALSGAALASMGADLPELVRSQHAPLSTGQVDIIRRTLAARDLHAGDTDIRVLLAKFFAIDPSPTSRPGPS